MVRSVLDHMPDRDMKGNQLDLARPELRPLVRRYHKQSVSKPASVGPRRTALVVTSPTAGAEPMIGSLRVRGWDVSTCSGPGQITCPVMNSQECSLRRSADVAVVYLNPDTMWPVSATLPRVRCAADSASPGMLALEGRHSEPSFSDNHATIGAERDPEIIVDALEVLYLRA